MAVIVRWIVLIGIVGALIGAGVMYVRRSDAVPTQLRTVKVTRGDLVDTIAATGTLEPEEVVDVGAQVAGQIVSFGNDVSGKPVDFKSEISEGAVIAKIDDAIYAADVTEASAQLDQAKAGVMKAQADLETMNSKLDQAARDWERAQKLGPSDALAESTYDNYRAVYEQAKANIGVGEAALTQAKASVSQAESTLSRAKRNLSYCTIYAPVSGTVIKRNVSIGQTVVSSLNAPSLFLIARDLRRMEVWVAVNEADVGKIYFGQPVSFSVDAFPEQMFNGVVQKIRWDASMTQNVVTYTVEVFVDNSDRRLIPYLTANVQFEVNRADDALLVPNAALRWTPRTEQVSPAVRAAMTNGASTSGEAMSEPTTQRTRGHWREGGDARASGSTSAATAPSTRPNAVHPRPGVVWVRDGEFVKPIRVMAGLTDGVQTVIRGQDVSEGLEVVVGESQVGTDAASAQPNTNPFLPQFPRRGGGGGGNRGGSGGGRGG